MPVPSHASSSEPPVAPVQLCGDDVRDLVGRAFAGMGLLDVDSDGLSLLERVHRALEEAGEEWVS